MTGKQDEREWGDMQQRVMGRTRTRGPCSEERLRTWDARSTNYTGVMLPLIKVLSTSPTCAYRLIAALYHFSVKLIGFLMIGGPNQSLY